MGLAASPSPRSHRRRRRRRKMIDRRSSTPLPSRVTSTSKVKRSVTFQDVRRSNTAPLRKQESRTFRESTVSSEFALELPNDNDSVMDRILKDVSDQSLDHARDTTHLSACAEFGLPQLT